MSRPDPLYPKPNEPLFTSPPPSTGYGNANSPSISSEITGVNFAITQQTVNAPETYIRQGLTKSEVLRKLGQLQAAYDIEMSLVRKYGWRKSSSIKHGMTVDKYGRFIKNRPALRQDQTLTMLGKRSKTVSQIIDYRDGIPNFTEGYFVKQTLTIDLKLARLSWITTDMPASYAEGIFPILNFKSEGNVYSVRTQKIYGVLTGN